MIKRVKRTRIKQRKLIIDNYAFSKTLSAFRLTFFLINVLLSAYSMENSWHGGECVYFVLGTSHGYVCLSKQFPKFTAGSVKQGLVFDFQHSVL